MLPACLLVGIAAMALGIKAQDSGNSSTQASKTSTTTATSTTTSTSTGIPTHTIAVGATGFKFEPNNITAAVGDIIEYNFYPGGHSVVRGDFGYPCIPYEDTGINRVGFFSGFQNPAVYTSDGPKFRVRVNDTAPIFYYCSAPGSCITQHMIGVVNPNATWTLEKQEDFVANATFQLNPGQPLPSETAGTTTTPTANPPPGSAASNNSSNSGSPLNAGQIAGIAIGAAALLVLAGALIYLCGRHSKASSASSPRVSKDRNSFPAGAMVDAKFGSPRSPGQSTFVSNPHYSVPPGNDPYRSGTHSPPMPGQYQGNSPGSPPAAHPSYTTFQNLGAAHQANMPLMAGMTEGGAQGYLDPRHHTIPPQQQQQAAVELPASVDPGNSPLPNYQPGRHYSWTNAAEAAYRPSSKQ